MKINTIKLFVHYFDDAGENGNRLQKQITYHPLIFSENLHKMEISDSGQE